MSATEQEAKIATLQKKLASFDSHGKGGGQGVGDCEYSFHHGEGRMANALIARQYSAASDSESSDDEESGSSEEE